ncbi:hypothetical protein BV22DRAFT_117494 [Leucogyrophana mollusca]|uniref:Uncharacterized protein n=1 Tax=Leucogyrophana mollusca TaxID=85980 RepID=A0ACB8BVL2_9AGAM|nr:hypothetical protein BV22DRAFT_117494 [Leucogyrophana mollusca]
MSTVGPPPSSIPGPSTQRPLSSTAAPAAAASTFEFTKRKRWADLLIHELSEAIIFILSNECHILFCGRAVNELLGWQDSELIDTDLTELVNADDRHGFQASFDESLHSRNELLCYVRLRCKTQYSQNPDYEPPSKEVLFELKGYPHYIDGESDCRCFFAVAKPYPSRNTAMLNTFLELKMENERLQQRLAELRVRVPLPGSSTGLGMPMYGGNPGPSSSQSLSSGALRPVGDMTTPAYYSSHQNKTSYEDPMSNSMRNNFDSLSALAYGSLYAPTAQSTSQTNTEDDMSEESAKRKKMRKMHAAEQYVCVTCGRTDSPEWRKGPQGPKTLCNACGLRWAKQVRTKIEEEQGGGELPNIPAP